MKKRRLDNVIACMTICVIMILSVIPQTLITVNAVAVNIWDGTIALSFFGGDGTQNNPYQVSTGSELAYLSEQVNSGDEYENTFFILTGDIDLNNHEWTPIGSETNKFNGNFDGNNKTVSNMSITIDDSSSTQYKGFFGYIGEYASIQGLSVVGEIAFNVPTSNIACGIFAGTSNGNITDCHTTGSIKPEPGYDIYLSHIGGFVGINYFDATIFGCSADVDIVNGRQVGGFVNENLGYMSDCYAKGDVSGATRVGGFVAMNSNGIIQNCVATGNVERTDNNDKPADALGGFAGINGDKIINCYATATVASDTNFGGFVGWNATVFVKTGKYNTGLITNGYYNVQNDIAIGKDATGAVHDIYPISVDYMKSREFANHLNSNINATGLDSSEHFYLVSMDNDLYVLPIVFHNGIGDGSSENPYIIETMNHLVTFSFIVNEGYDFKDKYMKLANDIRLDKEWIPIGSETNKFNGNFDGNNKTVSGMSIIIEGVELLSDYGFFGYIGEYANIQGLTAVGDITFGVPSSSIACGIFAGTNAGNMTDCHVRGSIKPEPGHDIYLSRIGGLAGINYFDAAIVGCSADVDIVNGRRVGGLVSENLSDISDCCAKGDVSGATQVGGFVGNNSNGPIVNCYATGSVTRTGNADLNSVTGGFGGFAGLNGDKIINCYATAKVASDTNFGGFVGWNATVFVKTGKYNTGLITKGYCNNQNDTAIGKDSTDSGHEIYSISLDDMKSPSFVDTLNENRPLYIADTTLKLWAWSAGQNDGFPYLTSEYLISVTHNGQKQIFDSFTQAVNYVDTLTDTNMDDTVIALNSDVILTAFDKMPENPCTINGEGHVLIGYDYNIYLNADTAFENIQLVATVINPSPSTDDQDFDLVLKQGFKTDEFVTSSDSGTLYIDGNIECEGFISINKMVLEDDASVTIGDIGIKYLNILDPGLNSTFIFTSYDSPLFIYPSMGITQGKQITLSVQGSSLPSLGDIIVLTDKNNDIFSPDAVLLGDGLSDYALIKKEYNEYCNYISANPVTQILLTTDHTSIEPDGTFIISAALKTGNTAVDDRQDTYITFYSGNNVLGNAKVDENGVAIFSWAPSSIGTYTDISADYFNIGRGVIKSNKLTLSVNQPQSSANVIPSLPETPSSGGSVGVGYWSAANTAFLSMNDDKIAEIIEKSDNNTAVFDVSGVNFIDKAELSKSALKSLSNASMDVSFALPLATVTLDNNAATSVSNQASGDKINIGIKPVASDSLTSAQQKVVKPDDLIFDINILSGGKNISEFDGHITIELVYDGLLPVTVWYLNDAGELEKVNCTYRNGKVTFILDHLSYYVIGQDIDWTNPFNDVYESDRYYEAVMFIAQNKITTGTTETTYSPESFLTRAQCLTLIMRAYRIQPDEDLSDNFTDAGNTYYTGYLAAAKRLGIANGVGNNMFAPDNTITRQEMFKLLYNALNVMDLIPKYDTKKTMKDFNDDKTVASWAKEAVGALIKAGIVTTSDNLINPVDSCTRAYMAQVLYNLLSQRY